MAKTLIPIFYACDDAFVKFTVVSASSLKANASKDFDYRIHVLHSGISDEMKQIALDLSGDGFEVVFNDVGERLEMLSSDLPVRDYYSKTTYFRLFIPDMFPEYDKALYIDSDTVVQGDISELFCTDLGENLLGACHEQAMVQTDNYGEYAEQVVGVSRYNYFNAGVLLLNCKRLREQNVLKKFSEPSMATILKT